MVPFSSLLTGFAVTANELRYLAVRFTVQKYLDYCKVIRKEKVYFSNRSRSEVLGVY